MRWIFLLLSAIALIAGLYIGYRALLSLAAGDVEGVLVAAALGGMVLQIAILFILLPLGANVYRITRQQRDQAGGDRASRQTELLEQQNKILMALARELTQRR